MPAPAKGARRGCQSTSSTVLSLTTVRHHTHLYIILRQWPLAQVSIQTLPSILGKPSSSRKPSQSAEGASYLQFVLLHGILQSRQEVSILLL